MWICNSAFSLPKFGRALLLIKTIFIISMILTFHHPLLNLSVEQVIETQTVNHQGLSKKIKLMPDWNMSKFSHYMINHKEN